MPTITLQIDGRFVSCEPGQTILQAARRTGIFIPSLCHHDQLPPLNACNLCVVEIERTPGCPTACTTPAAQDMVVRTDTPRLLEIRYKALREMIRHHPNPCILCESRRDCEYHQTRKGAPPLGQTRAACLQHSGLKIGGMTVDLSLVGSECSPDLVSAKVEADDPFVNRDYNYCVTCGLCWRACEQVQGRLRPDRADAPEWAARIKALGPAWASAGCTYCGACVDVCPSGTLIDRFARDREISTVQPVTTCTLCDHACSLKVLLGEGRVASTSVPRLDFPSRICAVGRFGYARILSDSKRLKYPMIRVDDELRELPWDQALEVIAHLLKPFQDGSFVAVVGHAETRENALMYELFARQAMNGQLVVIEPQTRKATLELLDREIRAGNVRAAIVAGNYLDATIMAELEYMVVADFRESRACDIAEAVLPVAILAELEGTIKTAENRLARLKKVVEPPGEARAEWTVLAELAAAMGCDLRTGVNGKTNGVHLDSAASTEPRDRIADLPRQFRGHLIGDIVPEFQTLGLPHTPAID